MFGFQDVDGMTALHRGAKGGDIKTIKYIVENRLVDVNQLVRTHHYPVFGKR